MTTVCQQMSVYEKMLKDKMELMENSEVCIGEKRKREAFPEHEMMEEAMKHLHLVNFSKLTHALAKNLNVFDDEDNVFGSKLRLDQSSVYKSIAILGRMLVQLEEEKMLIDTRTINLAKSLCEDNNHEYPLGAKIGKVYESEWVDLITNNKNFFLLNKLKKPLELYLDLTIKIKCILEVLEQISKVWGSVC